RSTAGKSFGLMKMSTASAISSSSPELKSNMVVSTPRGAPPATAGAPMWPLRGRSAGLVGLGLRRLGRRMVDLAGVLLRRLDLGGLSLGMAFFKGFDPGREAAHQFETLAAAAEQQQKRDADEQPMYPAEGPHCFFPPREQVAPRAPAPLFSLRN